MCVLVLTTYDADEWVIDAIRNGAAGYLLKGALREASIAAVRGTVEGDAHVDPSGAGKLFAKIASSPASPDTSVADSLSQRESEVLRLVALSLTNADIAGRLHLSEGTVRNYVSAVPAELDVSDRTRAAVIALRYGLIDLSEI